MECAGSSLDDWYLVPESVLGFYRDNLETLSAAVGVARCLQEAGLSSFPDLDNLER
jgi:hypothetical protein